MNSGSSDDPGFKALFYAYIQGMLPFIRKLFALFVGLLVLTIGLLLLLDPGTSGFYLMVFSTTLLLIVGIAAGLAILLVEDPTEGKPLGSFEDQF